MKLIRKISLAVIIAQSLLWLYGCQNETQEEEKSNDAWSISSPDSSVVFRMNLKQGKLTYSTQKGGVDALNPSALGIIRNDQNLYDSLEFVSTSDIIPIAEPFTMLTGKQSSYNNAYNEQTVTFQNPAGAKLALQCRVYDRGIAFRYLFPESTGETVTLLEEKTTFNFPSGNMWVQPYDSADMWRPAYEAFFENGVAIGTKASNGCGWAFPALLQTQGQWMLLSDAGIDGDYCGTHFDNDEGSTTFSVRWPEEGEALGVGEQLPTSTLPWQTSWKFLAIGTLEEVASSEFPRALCAPSRVSDISWIKPGRASWSWLSKHNSPKDYNQLKPYVDLAVEMGWEYSLVDANWGQMKNGTIEQLVEYANEKGIGILMWYNSAGPHNEVTEKPRDIMDNPEKRKAEFAKLQEWGVKGVKIDFFQSDKQFIMALYKDILEDAAKHQILVNFHGCAIPRGWSRTYPHLMTMESVRGAECYTFDKEYPGRAAEHNTILPFTRNVIGSMDYTPVIFTDMENPHETTFGHELALSVVFESGILHMADAMEGYQTLPSSAKSFLQTVPATWDTYKLLQAQPGEFAVIARRKGDNWYIGGINGTKEAKAFDLDLSWMGDTDLELIADGNNEKEFSTQIVNSKQKISVNTLGQGGFVLRSIKK